MRPPGGRGDAPSTLELIGGVFALIEVLGPAAGDLPVPHSGALDADAQIAYRIAAAVVEDVDTRQQILEERCEAERRRLVYDVIIELLDAASRVADRRSA